jgi:hypothetical protein
LEVDLFFCQSLPDLMLYFKAVSVCAKTTCAHNQADTTMTIFVTATAFVFTHAFRPEFCIIKKEK